jgi:hypothetical protein
MCMLLIAGHHASSVLYNTFFHYMVKLCIVTHLHSFTLDSRTAHGHTLQRLLLSGVAVGPACSSTQLASSLTVLYASTSFVIRLPTILS